MFQLLFITKQQIAYNTIIFNFNALNVAKHKKIHCIWSGQSGDIPISDSYVANVLGAKNTCFDGFPTSKKSFHRQKTTHICIIYHP